MKTILDVETDPREAIAIASVLSPEFRVLHCAARGEALGYAARECPAAVLVDLPDAGPASLRLIGELVAARPGLPVIAMSGLSDPRTIIAAVRCGATDFLARPLRVEELRAALLGAIVPAVASPFIGNSPASMKCVTTLRKYARSHFPILLTGESGTGKEIAARAIHGLSSRKDRPFVARNCAALPENLIESELFGSARGAFTGAVERPGAFGLADGGTLFLDEIGDAGGAVQAKLLRVLETGEFWRLGDRTPRKVDVRLVSATSRKLDEAVEAGGFRRDLLHRINTLVLELPPLRERLEDLPAMAVYFAAEAAGTRKRFGAEALERLGTYRWPGNVRELKNVVHRAIVLSEDLEEIRAEHIQF